MHVTAPPGVLAACRIKKRGIVMRVLLFLALIYPAMASALTGNDLLAGCESEDKFVADRQCLAYLNGIYDAHWTLLN